MRPAMQRNSAFFIWPLALLCLTGCGGDNDSSAPKIRFGEEVCVHCRMIISDNRFAAALTTDDGQTLRFDDTGCLLEYRAAHSDPIQRYWVSDYTSADWLDAEQAMFVKSDDLVTPMASGIAALSTADEARRVAEPMRGTILRFDELASATTQAGTGQKQTD